MAEVDVDLHDEGTENGTVYQTAKTKFYQSIWRLDFCSLLFAQQIGCSSMSLDFFWDREEGEGCVWGVCVCVCVWGGGCSVFFRRSVHSRNSSSVKEQEQEQQQKNNNNNNNNNNNKNANTELFVCLSLMYSNSITSPNPNSELNPKLQTQLREHRALGICRS